MALAFAGWLASMLRRTRGQAEDRLVTWIVAGLSGAVAIWVGQFVPLVKTELQRELRTSAMAFLLAMTGFFALGALAATASLRPLLRRLADEAATDGLTGVANSKHMNRRLTEEVLRSLRSSTQCALVVFDLDGFKAVNDGHGYAAGDRVLREFAQFLRQNVRAWDSVFRYKHGDEFAIIATNTDGAGVRALVERLRGQVVGYEFQAGPSTFIRLTCSAGVSVLAPGETDAAGLVERAERGLALAKMTKNRVELVEGTARPASANSVPVAPWTPSAPR